MAKQLLALSLDNDQLSPERVSAVLQALEKNPPRQYLSVLRQYRVFVLREIRRTEALIEYAGEITEETVSSIERSFSEMYGRKITSVTRQNPSLLAGLRIRIASDLHEMSVVDRLQTLARSV